MPLPNLLSAYAASYNRDEQERLEARFRAIEQIMGLNTSVLGTNARTLLGASQGKLDFTGANADVISATGAISTLTGLTAINSAGGAVVASLAAPTAAQDGQLKIITMSSAANSSTLSGTNIDGKVGTVGTFNAITKVVVLMAVSLKWQLVYSNVTFA